MNSALLLPGSASTTDFVRRAFPQVLADCEILRWTPAGGDAQIMATHMADYLADLDAGPVLIIGVSIGAHAAALWAGSHHRPNTRLLLALPAWTGPASQVAAMTAVAAQRIEDNGLPTELQRLTAQYPDDWVTAELVRAWGQSDPAELVATLRATATSSAPTVAQLHTITMPTLVLGLHDDPMHPWSVAQQWAQAIPGAALVGLSRSDPQLDLTAFGRACISSPWARPNLGE